MSKAFDRFAKLLATAGSRRDALKALGSLLAGGFLMGLTGKAAAQILGGPPPPCEKYCRSCRGLRGGVYDKCLVRCQRELEGLPPLGGPRKLCGVCTASTPFTACAAAAGCCTPKNGNYCANLQSDAKSCGSCGTVCTAKNSTGKGNTASDTFRCCRGKCADLSTDVNNCGACGNDCAAGLACYTPGTVATCTKGVCVYETGDSSDG